ncbi:MAG: hypothetical protein ABSA57_10245 [Candidatus Acidiferrales bacterium]|jgi:hypothetical protein
MIRRNGVHCFAVIAVAMLALAAITPKARAQATATDVNQKELHDYVLTMDKITKLASTQKDIDDLQKSDPAMTKDMSSQDSNGKSIDQMAQGLAKYPPVIAILKRNGFGAREYIVATLTLIQVGTAVGFKKAGTYNEYPPQMLKLVSQANLTFVEQHWDDITKAMPAFSGGAPGPK